jgi:type IV pilus assembly protein PilM
VSESIWKKEIHLGRKKAAKAAKGSGGWREAAPVQAPAPVKSQSFWKKERHLFGRKKEATSPRPSPEATAAQVVSAYRVTAPPPRPAHLPEFAPPTAVVDPPPSPAEPAPLHTELAAPHVAEPDPPVAPEAVEAAPVPVELGPAPSVEPAPPVAPWAPPPAAPPAELAPPVEQLPAPAVEPPAPVIPRHEYANPVVRESAPPAWLIAGELEPPAAEPAPVPERVVEPEHVVAAAAAAAALPSIPDVAQAEPEPEPALVVPTAVATDELQQPEPEQPTSPEEPQPEKTPSTEKPKKSKGREVKRVVGLRIGSTKLAAAHVANNGKAELVQLAQAPIERGLVIGGEVRDADGLARELKQFFSANKLPRKGIRLGIASNRIGVRLVDVPTVDDDKQFENAIRFRAQELLPIPITDAILDFVRLGETVGENEEPLTSVLLVFAHRELVGRYVEVCRTAGLRLSGIDLEAFALLRALATPRAEDEEPAHAVVAVAVGHDRTVLAVSDGRVCSLTRVLEWGSAQIDVAIARTLDLTPSQAEPIKLALSLTRTEPPDGISGVQLEAVRSAMKAEIGVLGRELVSSLRFYQSRPDSLAIGEVLLSGGGAQLDGFAEELQGLLGAPVCVADPFGRVEPARKVTLPEQPGALAIAVGLGIED